MITTEQGMQHRTKLLLGSDALERLQRIRVLIFGVGGVGSWCAECLIRSGVRHLTLVDSDRVCVTNCNRQLMATSKTIGQMKVEVLKARLLDINPDADIVSMQKIYCAETAEEFRMEEYDYIVDAIDSLKDKADLIIRATALPKGITLVSSMGAALRRDPFLVRKGEFWSVKGDPLARALRNKFKKQKTYPKRKFMCVYSEENPMKNLGADTALDEQQLDHHEWSPVKAQANGSLCHITTTFGMGIAGIIINDVFEKGQR